MDRLIIVAHPAEVAFAREHCPSLFADYQVIEQDRIFSAPQPAIPREALLHPAPAPRSKLYLAARLTSIAAAMQGL